METRYKSVWDAIESTPDDAASMKVRAALMRAIATHIRSSGMTDADAAGAICVAESRIKDLVQGKIENFNTDELVAMLAAANLDAPNLS